MKPTIFLQIWLLKNPAKFDFFVRPIRSPVYFHLPKGKMYLPWAISPGLRRFFCPVIVWGWLSADLTACVIHTLLDTLVLTLAIHVDLRLALHQISSIHVIVVTIVQQCLPNENYMYLHACINVKPEGGHPGHMWGIWPLLPSPSLGIWLRIWVPGWGRFLFLHRGKGPSHIVPCARLCADADFPFVNARCHC